MLQSEQKPVNWITDVVLKVGKAGEQAVNICTGTLATGIIFLQSPQHLHVVGCEKNLMCFVEFLPSVVEDFPRRVLNPELKLV